MKISKLKNGLTLIYENKKTETVTVEVTVKVGSNYENEKISGISHFIEHMMFEGTRKRVGAKEISGEIESIGGEVNAYTSNERTCYYIKVPKKHLDKALDLLSDILKNSIFAPKRIEKERKIILKEINLHKDEPRYYQWVVFQKALFKKIKVRLPTAGTVKSVKGLTRRVLVDYFHKYYVANNMIVSVVGDVSGLKSKISKYFGKFRKGIVPDYEDVNEPEQTKKIVAKEKRKILNSYMVLGYKTPNRVSGDSYVLDVLKAILGKGQSGRIENEIRNKYGLAYEVGVYHEPSQKYGFFAVYLNTHKKNIPLAVKLILKEFKGLNKLSKKELEEAKGYLEGKFILDNEDTHDRADELGFWELVSDAKDHDKYLSRIRKVTVKDVQKVAKKYFSDKYTLGIIEQA